MMHLHIDFETYSEANLKKVGAWRYSIDPTTEVICFAYALNDEDPKLWKAGDPLPAFLKPENSRQLEFYAWNSFFEYCIMLNVLKIEPPKFENWHDPSAFAAALNLPRGLDDCGKFLGMSKTLQKDARGEKLIIKLCKPVKGKRIYDDGMLEELYEYCKQDVVSERAISQKLKKLHAQERNVWILDQKINARGICVDLRNVNRAIELKQQEIKRFDNEVSVITNGDLSSTRQVKKLTEFITTKGYEISSLNKASIKQALSDQSLPKDVARLLEIRKQVGKTSLAKYDVLKAITDPRDSKIRGLLLYHGASTGRWSGKLFQPQNLNRPTIKDTDLAIKLLSTEKYDAIPLIYGDVLEYLSSCLRGMLCASPAHKFISSDYSAIEPRVLAWLAGSSEILNVFSSHGLLYEHAASLIYDKPIEEVASDERFIGKIATLALGYGGGFNAFLRVAKDYDVDIDQEFAQEIVEKWRAKNTEIVNFWKTLQYSAIKAVKYVGTVTGTDKIAFKMIKDTLFCQLPSKRCLAFQNPTIEMGDYGEELHYFTTDPRTKKYCRTKTYGGMLAENVTQAIARDIMANAMLNLEDKGYKIVLTVHDEVLAEVPINFGSVEEFESIMCKLPEWAQGIPIAASGGYESKRYRK